MVDRFHDQAFDEGTKTKLALFELYAREWLPVFLAQSPPKRPDVHLFDFFAGPGSDIEGTPGSPLRLAKQLSDASRYAGWSRTRLHLHLFDADHTKIDALRGTLRSHGVPPPDVALQIEAKPFDQAFREAEPILRQPTAAKLVFIDQFGVGQVDDERFRALAAFPACDFLFFISSSTLNRFHGHPAIKQKIQRPNDYYHVHRAVVEYYRNLLPRSSTYFLAPFSIKKDSNIYGVVFGSAHPLGIDKFLQIAWQQDEMNGEADFDVDRNNVQPSLIHPTKVSAFEEDLESGLLTEGIRDERDILTLVFRHGVLRQHAKPVLKRLKSSGTIQCSFRVPSVAGFKNPRPLSLKGH